MIIIFKLYSCLWLQHTSGKAADHEHAWPASSGVGWELPTVMPRLVVLEVFAWVSLSVHYYCCWYFQVSHYALSWTCDLPCLHIAVGTARWELFSETALSKLNLFCRNMVNSLDFWEAVQLVADSFRSPHANLALGTGTWCLWGCSAPDPRAGLPWLPSLNSTMAGRSAALWRQRLNLGSPKPSLGLSNLHLALEPLFYWACLRFWHPETRSQLSLGVCFN